MHIQGLHHLALGSVLIPLQLAHHTLRCLCLSLVPEATQEASWGPLKGAVSAQKALQGSMMEMKELMGGTKERCPPMRDHWLALQANQWFFTKRNRTKRVSGQTCYRLPWPLQPEGTFWRGWVWRCVRSLLRGRDAATVDGSAGLVDCSGKRIIMSIYALRNDPNKSQSQL